MGRVIAGLVVLLFAPQAWGRDLRPPSRAEIDAAMPLLRRGTVAVVESGRDGWLRQVAIMTVANAPREVVFRTIADVTRYPEFLHNFSEVTVRQRFDRLVAYSWLWRGVLFDFQGANVMALTPPADVDIRTTSGDLGDGRFLIDLEELPGGKTLVVSTQFTDPRRGNWLARTLVSQNPSLLHGMNLAVGMVLSYGVRARSEEVAGHPPGRRGRRVGRFRGFGDVDVASLRPLLARGEVAVVETGRGGVLEQAAVFGAIRASADRVRRVVADPARYADFVSNVESSDVLESSDDRVVYDMEIDSPILDMDGRMELRRNRDGSLAVACTEGDLEGGRWAWEFRDGAPGSVAVHYGYTHMARANFVFRRLIRKEPFFDHGLNVGEKLIMVRSVRTRAEAAP